MQLALPNKHEQKTRGLTSCRILKAVSHETEVRSSAFGAFPTDGGENFQQDSHCKNLFFNDRLKHIAKDMIKIEEDLVILATNRDSWETRLEPK